MYGSSTVLENPTFYGSGSGSGSGGESPGSSGPLSMLSLVGGAWCWNSGRGVVGDFQSSLGGVCSASYDGDVCYVYFSSGGTSEGDTYDAVRTMCLLAALPECFPAIRRRPSAVPFSDMPC